MLSLNYMDIKAEGPEKGADRDDSYHDGDFDSLSDAKGGIVVP